jgi:hypothetical protein
LGKHDPGLGASFTDVARGLERTREWRDFHRASYDLYTSQVVLDEASDGDTTAAHDRLKLLAGLRLLDIDAEVSDLADELLARAILPPAASRDALHIACSAVHRRQFLLTWNCRHIANPHIQDRIRACISRHGIDLPVICTREEFIGDDDSNPAPWQRDRQRDPGGSPHPGSSGSEI